MPLSLTSKLQLAALGVLAVATITEPQWATDVKGATQALEQAGLKPVKVGGFSHSFDDLNMFSTDFEAVTAAGKTVTGRVGTPLLFGRSTIEIGSP